MSEVPEHSYHDSESSESEKDSVYDFLVLSLIFLNLYMKKCPKIYPDLRT